MAPDIEACPRGSYMSMVRRSSALSRNHWRRWNMVWPGRTPTPPVMTRVGIPSVCEATPCRTRLERMRSTETVVDGLLGDVPDRSEEHTSELQSRGHVVCRLLLEKQQYA